MQALILWKFTYLFKNPVFYLTLSTKNAIIEQIEFTKSSVDFERRICYMKYTKPVVLKPVKGNGAVCGGGSPCGRPCTKRA